MQQMSSCPKCRALLPYGSESCSYCGYQLYAPMGTYEQTQTQNTSGQGRTAIVPSEIKGWNWGAFLIAPIWGIFNRVWIALLGFIPIPLLGLIISFILGAKGNELAWQSKKWESIEHFYRTQRKWMYWGIGVSIFSLVLLVILELQLSSPLLTY